MADHASTRRPRRCWHAEFFTQADALQWPLLQKPVRLGRRALADLTAGAVRDAPNVAFA
jgi:hypothetical protein